jgi:hypothetical protein
MVEALYLQVTAEVIYWHNKPGFLPHMNPVLYCLS